MRQAWLVLFVALVSIIASDHAAGGAATQTPAAQQAPPAPPQLVRGTLSDAKGPVPGRWLVFMATTNRCPDTCSCDDGTCSGGKDCEGKLCVHGVVTRTNFKGTFGIRLRPDKYDVRLDSAIGGVLQAGVEVKPGPPIELTLRVDKAVVGDGPRK